MKLKANNMKINAISNKHYFYKMLFENLVPCNMHLRITTQPTV